VLRCTKTIAVLALAGCGARDALSVTSGSGGTGGASGAGGASAAQLMPECAPDDGAAVQIDIDDTPSCPGSGEQRPGLQLFIWGPDLEGLHDGVTLQVSGDTIYGYTTAGRLTAPNAPLVAATSGSVVFTTFAVHQGATGTYDITLVDGTTAQGSFTANACPGYSLCR
jgi:hypothetical protein